MKATIVSFVSTRGGGGGWSHKQIHVESSAIRPLKSEVTLDMFSLKYLGCILRIHIEWDITWKCVYITAYISIL